MTSLWCAHCAATEENVTVFAFLLASGMETNREKGRALFSIEEDATPTGFVAGCASLGPFCSLGAVASGLLVQDVLGAEPASREIAASGLSTWAFGEVPFDRRMVSDQRMVSFAGI